MDRSKPQISILVAEDEAITLEHICLVLSKKYPSFNIYQAPDGKRGVELFRLHTPDIVITDINMPGMSGIEMATEINAIKAGTSFIVLTGNVSESISEDSATSGIKLNHYIEKPILLHDLFYAVEKCVEEVTQWPVATG